MEKAPTLESFLSSLLASVQSGKIKRDRKCLLCGSKLSDDGLKSIQVRMGRLRYLIRSIDEGSATAAKLVHNIIHIGEYLGGRDIPENYPEWWLEAVEKIRLETSAVRRERERTPKVLKVVEDLTKFFMERDIAEKEISLYLAEFNRIIFKR